MPEIWLGYGSTDVVLDIKFENLSLEMSPAFKALPEDEIKSTLETISLQDNLLLLVLSSSKSVARIVFQIVMSCRRKGFSNLTVDVPGPIASALRADLSALATGDSQEIISVNRVEPNSYSLANRLEKFGSAITVCQTCVDPLFGFGGTPTCFLRNFFPNEMAEAFSSRQSNLPSPGIADKPLSIAIDVAAKVKVSQAIEIIAGGRQPGDISGLAVGPVSDVFSKSISQLKSGCAFPPTRAKVAIASAGRGSEPHSTLHNSLNSLWNCISYVEEGGSAVLVAENRNGVGGGALQMCAEGKLNIDELDPSFANVSYVAGLEHLMYIKELRKKCDIGIVSSLPKYYVTTKLGFSVFRGMKEALEITLQKRGKGSKILVIPEGDLCMPALTVST